MVCAWSFVKQSHSRTLKSLKISCAALVGQLDVPHPPNVKTLLADFMRHGEADNYGPFSETDGQLGCLNFSLF